MKIEEQVCSLEPSRKLEELGVKQESQYWWVSENGEDFFLSNEMWRVVGDWVPEQEGASPDSC